uniref:Fe2OG dioxygenase domain-containing protein n=1 Tax=Haptolina ericina TaxID=156174 RepID=A0A7S3BR99_9EUKA
MLERDVLPAAEAAELLRWLQDDAKEWQRGEWVVHGRTHEIPRTSAWFTLDGDDQGDSEVSGNVSVYGKHGTRSAPPALREAAAKVAGLVRQLRPASDWVPSGALANRYRDGSETVGEHSDFLNQLGPRPIIVGLSLGAARRFDFTEARDGGAAIRMVLPHNSALVMWKDAQESWLHAVPRCAEKAIGRHPISGSERISLTFRMR